MIASGRWRSKAETRPGAAMDVRDRLKVIMLSGQGDGCGLPFIRKPLGPYKDDGPPPPAFAE
jgi:hypothetical protein